jgi:hypothetical protein
MNACYASKYRIKKIPVFIPVLSLCLKYQTINMYRDVEVQLHTFLTSAIDEVSG